MIAPRTFVAGLCARMFVALALSIVVAACATNATSIEQQWISPAINQAHLQKVVALYIGGDVTTRRAAEDRLAQRLASKGVLAVPAYHVLNDRDARNLDTAKARLRAAGFDGVVTMRLVDASTEVDYVPSTINGCWGVDWPCYGYYGYGYGHGYGFAGYPVVEKVVRVETTAYDLDDNQLVWSALSRTVDPDGTADLINEVTSVVANELGRRGVVVAMRPRTPSEG